VAGKFILAKLMTSQHIQLMMIQQKFTVQLKDRLFSLQIEICFRILASHCEVMLFLQKF